MATVAQMTELKVSKHAKERMMERNIMMVEVREVLKTGKRLPHQKRPNCVIIHGREDGMKLVYNVKENVVITVFYNDCRSYVL